MKISRRSPKASFSTITDKISPTFDPPMPTATITTKVVQITESRAILQFEESKIIAEVHANIRKDPDHGNSEVLVTTRIVEILGSRVTTQIFEHVFPLRRLDSHRYSLCSRLRQKLREARRYSCRKSLPWQAQGETLKAWGSWSICKSMNNWQYWYLWLGFMACVLFSRLLILCSDFFFEEDDSEEVLDKSSKSLMPCVAAGEQDTESLPVYDSTKIPDYIERENAREEQNTVEA